LKKLVFIFICLLLILPQIAFCFCFEEAGERYGISPQLLWGIAKVESNFNPYAVNSNSNGTYDFGVMQINSSWYRTLGKELWGQLGDPCTNVYTGAWILARCIQRHGYTWEAVGCYNASSRCKKVRYAKKVYQELIKAAAEK